MFASFFEFEANAWKSGTRENTNKYSWEVYVGALEAHQPINVDREIEYTVAICIKQHEIH